MVLKKLPSDKASFYKDAIVNTSKRQEEHIQQLENVLQHLKKHGL
jgi:bacterioferritin (cytochrome b1)